MIETQNVKLDFYSLSPSTHCLMTRGLIVAQHLNCDANVLLSGWHSGALYFCAPIAPIGSHDENGFIHTTFCFSHSWDQLVLMLVMNKPRATAA